MLRLSIFFVGVLAGVAIAVAQRPTDQATGSNVVVRGLTDGMSVRQSEREPTPTPEPTEAPSQRVVPNAPAPVAEPTPARFERKSRDGGAVVVHEDGDLVASFENHNSGDTPDVDGKGETKRDDDVDPPDRD
jgi:hypothetical protein